MKPALLALLCLLLSSCAAAVSHGPQIYRVGELEVRLYEDQERLARDLPSILSTVQALTAGGAQVKVLGYFDRQNKRIYSLNDTRVLLHELKHYLEPEWRHDIGCTHLTALDDRANSSCKEPPFTRSARGNLESPALVVEPLPDSHASEDTAAF